jgi:hypothetical protein
MARKKSIWRKDLKYGINDFANMCGFFNGETYVNNGYGCNHPKQEETEIQWIDDPQLRPHDDRFERKIILALLRRKYGSYKNIIAASETEEGKKYIIEIRKKLLFDNEVLGTLKLKRQGKCYAFSCPLGRESPHESDMIQPYETVYELPIIVNHS